MLASKYIKIVALLDCVEMKELLDHLGDFLIFEIGRISAQIELTHEQFFHNYCSYVQKLQRGEKMEWPLSLAFTTDRQSIKIQTVGEKFLSRPQLPILQLQPGRLRYSEASGDFQMGALGEGISWGIQFSYPFLFQSAEGEIAKVDRSFPNTELFFKLQRWIRHNTRATPFQVDSHLINVPVRLGHDCFSWINQHPDLKGVSVAC